jgi:uncharacterized protein YxeA
MDVGKLYKIAKELNDNIQSAGLKIRFATITQNIQKLTQQGQTTIQTKQQILANIESSKREISTAINTFIPTNLSVEDGKVYESIGAYELFGYTGKLRFLSIFNDLQSNSASVRNELQKYQQEINKITQLYSSLAEFSEKLPKADEGLVKNDLIVLFFQEGAEINNLDELAKVSTQWNKVLIAFALLSKDNDTNFRIETVERGSIILTLSAIAGVVFALGKAVDKVLDTVKKYYEIKKLAHEAKQIKGVPESAIRELENSSKLKLKTEANEIARQLIEEYGWNEKSDRKDVDSAVRIAVRQLLEFVNKGGKVDIKLLAQNSDKKEMEVNISLKYKEIKSIENIIAPDGNNQKLEITDGEQESNDDNKS